MDVNDDAGCLDERGVWALVASKLAPTVDWVHTVKMVGVSLLAMDVNDAAGRLDERGVWAFFASKLAPTRTGGVRDNRVAYMAAFTYSGSVHRSPCRSRLAGDKVRSANTFVA